MNSLSAIAAPACAIVTATCECGPEERSLQKSHWEVTSTRAVKHGTSQAQREVTWLHRSRCRNGAPVFESCAPDAPHAAVAPQVLRTDICMDVGKSLNPAIDIGQVEGGFVQGMGWSCIEELVWGDAEHKWVRPGTLHTRGPGV